MKPTLAMSDHIPNFGEAVKKTDRLGKLLMFLVDRIATAGFSSSCSAHCIIASFSCL